MATKYVSALDGPSMDAALQDMAYHNSEAWAVGTRNGVAVSGSDVTYHNNAKYYSDKVSTDTDRAEAAAARAEAAVPAGTAGAVFFDTAQSLTTTQQYQAKANIGAGSTNPNLLDNPWWGSNEVINQRGISSGNTPSMAYTLDRWKMSYGTSVGTYSLGTSGLTMTGSTGAAIMLQIPESRLNNYLYGKTVTGSILLSDGTIISGSGTYTQNSQIIFAQNGDCRIIKDSSNNIRVNVFDGKTVTIRAVKLELGTVSTLANDVPPDYGTELRKCMRYFRRLAPQQSGMVLIGRANNTTLANFLVGTEPMVKITGITATITGECYVRAGDNTNHAITAVNAQSTVGSGVMLECTTSGITAYAPAAVILAAGAHIDISADL